MGEIQEQTGKLAETKTKDLIYHSYSNKGPAEQM